MIRPRVQSILVSIVVVMVLAIGTSAEARQGRSIVPESFVLNEAASKALSAEWLTDEERRQLRVFHGVWDQRDLTTPIDQAIIALNAWDFDDPSLSSDQVPAEIRAEARLRQGEMHEAIELLGDQSSFYAARIRAEAYESLGDLRRAEESVSPVIEAMLDQQIDDPAELTQGVAAMVVLARIQGQPSRDFQAMMKLLALAHQQIDRLYWPARLEEAKLLLDKDNTQDAVAVLHETLSLNPRCADAWYALGKIALDMFDFDSAQIAANALTRLNPEHPLAGLLMAQSQLIQDDPEGAQEALEPIIRSWPKMLLAHAYLAATQALYYDEDAKLQAIARFEALSPGSGLAHYIMGKHLSLNRQYGAAAEALEEAIRRHPAWPTPQIELGLMELQSGREDRALDVLQSVTQLDPFNKRAANSLFLLEELAGYDTVESEHFIVRYKPGEDEVLVDMMLEQLERIHQTVSSRFQFEPDRKTTIEVMPDHKRFAVRITGMPFIHTIAACTGPVIAMEVPREGPPSKHLGRFDWPRVIQHEYTHTITLAQTNNRIPHWLTEAAAVSMELAPQKYETCLMLADSYQKGTLFNLDEIKWAFVRPRQPSDRGKAYAQSHWMVKFMNERFGDSALIRLLARYYDGEREEEAIPAALSLSREEFFQEFLAWAGEEVKFWGLAPEPSLEELVDTIRREDPVASLEIEKSRNARLEVIVKRMSEQIGEPSRTRVREVTAQDWPDLVRPPVEISDEQLDQWLSEFPDHPDLLEVRIRRRLKSLDGRVDESLVQLLEHYAAVRPVDPLPHRKLALYYLEGETSQEAIPHLEMLDRIEEKTPVFTTQLAKLYRETGRSDLALAKATRALFFDPYHAPSRELAATIALERGDLELARRHIKALTLIEPNRPQHQRRLDAIDRMLESR